MTSPESRDVIFTDESKMSSSFTIKSVETFQIFLVISVFLSPCRPVELTVKPCVEGGGWRVESGEWRVESGEWRVEGGEWSVEGG